MLRSVARAIITADAVIFRECCQYIAGANITGAWPLWGWSRAAPPTNSADDDYCILAFQRAAVCAAHYDERIPSSLDSLVALRHPNGLYPQSHHSSFLYKIIIWPLHWL